MSGKASQSWKIKFNLESIQYRMWNSLGKQKRDHYFNCWCLLHPYHIVISWILINHASWECSPFWSIHPQIAKFMGPTWVLSAPDGPHVGPMNLAIRVWNIKANDMCRIIVVTCWIDHYSIVLTACGVWRDHHLSSYKPESYLWMDLWTEFVFHGSFVNSGNSMGIKSLKMIPYVQFYISRAKCSDNYLHFPRNFEDNYIQKLFLERKYM